MGATERVVEYLEFKGISKYKFCKDLGFSNKFLDNSSNMGTDKACKILHYYSEINAEWLLTGNGSMLKSDIIPIPIVKVDDTDKLERDNEQLKETNELLRFKVSTLEKQLAEFRYNSQKEPVLYRNVAESAPELIKKKPK